MHIQAAQLPTITRRTGLTAAACAVAIAGSATFLATEGNDATAPAAAPAPAASPASDLSRYDSALLHHHNVRVPRTSPQVGPTAAQRRAADRFHHR